MWLRGVKRRKRQWRRQWTAENESGINENETHQKRNLRWRRAASCRAVRWQYQSING